MANKATSDAVRADMQPANFRAAVQKIRTAKAKKDRISGINGEIADIYAKVEGFKVNRKAGKIFFALDNMEAEERNDIIRSLNGLFDAAGWDEDANDLVDQAEGNVHHLRFGDRRAEDDGDEDIDDAVGDGGSGDEIDEAMAGEASAFEASAEELASQKDRQDIAAKRETEAAAPSTKRERRTARPKESSEPAPGTGAAARKAMKEAAAPAPFTGDNSDLANPQGNA